MVCFLFKLFFNQPKIVIKSKNIEESIIKNKSNFYFIQIYLLKIPPKIAYFIVIIFIYLKIVVSFAHLFGIPKFGIVT